MARSAHFSHGFNWHWLVFKFIFVSYLLLKVWLHLTDMNRHKVNTWICIWPSVTSFTARAELSILNEHVFSFNFNRLMLNNPVSSKDRCLDKRVMCIRVSTKLICFIETFIMIILFVQFIYTHIFECKLRYRILMTQIHIMVFYYFF